MENESQQTVERNQQPLFESQTIYTLEVFRDFWRSVTNSKIVNIIFLVLASGLALFVALGLLGMLVSGGIPVDIVPGLIMIIAVIAMLFLYVFLFAPLIIKSMYKKNCEMNGEPNWQEHTFFCDDYLVVTTKNATVRHDYTKFGKIIETRHFFILLIGKKSGMLRVGICINKHGFTKGDYESFKQFICWRTGLPIKFVK